MEKKLILILLEKVKLLENMKLNFSSGKEIITLNHEAFDRAALFRWSFNCRKMVNEKKTWTLFYERFIELFIMNEKEKAKNILKILNKIYPTTPIPLKHKNILHY